MIQRCWCVRICSTRLCLCLDFLWQIGHSNFGSTPHSNRIWRFRLCGRAYELPHCLHINAPPELADPPLPPPEPVVVLPPPVGPVSSSTVSRSVFTENGVAGVMGVTAVAATAGGTMISRRHVAGVNKRKSQGWSSNDSFVPVGDGGSGFIKHLLATNDFCREWNEKKKKILARLVKFCCLAFKFALKEKKIKLKKKI